MGFTGCIYMQINETPDVSKGMLWEALKAYVRGQMISYSAQLTRKQNARRKAITEEIVELDKEYAESPNPELLSERTSLQTEFNLLSTSETTKLINCSRHRYYEHGEKIGRQLARQIGLTEASRHITEVVEIQQRTTQK